ncbi:XRE family transcriptional regulator [Methyloligella sp. 2.7D]|uniref:helix-turn-helix domain-containing protein n=1 Tax=unclassified Methyloligella TaxID=2625955 RepID=UPI00157D7FBE|nr:XRE family transcriptional regulator [Methyloligella sp. GL2]QKP78081.1 helix-turn-helix transcriptional regulator [Methyloligella sp. GL2]
MTGRKKATKLKERKPAQASPPQSASRKVITPNTIAGAGAKFGAFGQGGEDDILRTGSSAPQEAATHSLAKAIGMQVRELRRKLDLTGAELAEQAGISAGMLSKIENGAVSASIESLEALARALNVPITSFFQSYEDQRDCSYVRAGNGVVIERRGTKAGHQYQLLGHSISGDIVVEPYLITLTEEADPYDLFQHAGVEFIYQLTGKSLYRHADKIYTLSPGDALFFDATALHGPHELLELPMTYLSIIVYPRNTG